MEQKLITGRAKVSSKGWAVIPKEIRDAVGIKPGDEVRFVFWPEYLGGPKLEIRKLSADPVAEGFGMLQDGDGRRWTDELVEEHAREVAEEEQELRERKGRNSS